MGDRTRRLLAGVLAVLTATGVLVALGAVPTHRAERAAVPPPTRSTTATRPPPTSDTERTGHPALAVKIDNVAAARPPVGIRAAEVVHVEPVEGGLSRLVAVFGEHRPPVIGPVRSARRTDLQLLAQYGSPVLAFSGAAPELLPHIARSAVVNASGKRVPAAYFRDGSRTAPNNLFVRPSRLPAAPPDGSNIPTRPGPAPPGGVPTEHHEVSYRSATVGFTWSDRQRRWLVSMDGRPYFDADGNRVTAGTVVIKHVPVHDSAIIDSAGNASPVATTVGTGRALVLRDGRAFDASWSRPSAGDTTRYTTAAGEPLPFASGQRWVVLVGR